MTKINCCICSRRTDTNKQRTRIGTASVWPLIEKHAEKIDLDISQLSKDDYICVKCHSTISHYRMSDRGPNKKIKICEPIVLETIITKQILRGYANPVLDTVSNMSTDNVVIDEELPMSIESNVDTEAVDPTVLPMSRSEKIVYLDDEVAVTTNADDWNLPVTIDSQNSESVSPQRHIEAERQSESQSQSQTESQSESQSESEPESQPESQSQNSRSTVKANVKIQGTVTTQSRCFICGSVSGRKAIPWPAIQQAWLEKKYYVSRSNRTCFEHLTEFKKFSDEALEMIQTTKENVDVSSDEFALWLHKVTDILKSVPYNFEDDGTPAAYYKMFFGITKENFDDLVRYLPDMRNTATRSVRTALAMFLLLLRNNIKQEIIAFNFNTTQQVVSKTIDTVSASLEEHFVPNHLGYHHITRDEALQQHSIKLTSKVLSQSESRICLISDCTYNYIEKPSDFSLQRKTFSAHKKRNLLKPLFIVFPNGYILEAAGPFFCDAKNNDAANIRHHYKNSDVLLFLEEEDYFIFDRGFRDVIEETSSNGQNVFMPRLLGGKRSHFTCEEANDSRKVTMLRWVVEAVNARYKNVFPFFKHTIEGSYVPKIMRFTRIACAIFNKYFPPLHNNQEFHDIIVEAASEINNVNTLKEEIERLGIQRMSARWIKASADTVSDFPQLTMDDLKRITLGTYQIKIAEKYIDHHMKENSEFGIFIHRENEEIIRAKIQSRFTKSKTHNAWVKYDSNENGYEAIKGLYCTCKVGERSLGCCSHLTSVVRFLGYDRYQPHKEKRCSTSWNAIDCGEESDNESSDSELDDF